MKKGNKPEAPILRQKAEELLKMKQLKIGLQHSKAETLKLIHELEVHQIELELQNEELMQAKSAIQDVIEKYTELYDFAPSGYFTLSKQGEIMELNLNGANMLGKERLHLINSQFGFFVSNNTKQIFYHFLEKVFSNNTKECCELTLLANNNSPIYVYLSGIVTNDREQCLATMIDITERKLADAELCEKEVQYHNLADSGMALIWASGTDKLYTYFNSPWLKFTGRDLEQEKGNGWMEGIHPDDFSSYLNTYTSSFNDRKAFDVEYRLRHLSGEYRWVRSLGTPNYNSRGEFIGYIGHCFDITDHKMVQEALTKAKVKAEESDRLKSAFLANMSHEIRTPMNGILGFAELLKEPNLTGEMQQSYINIIEISGARMLNIINDIINISKVESGQMEISIVETNINEQIEYIFTFFKPEVEQKKIQIFFKNSLPAKEAIIKTDREKVYAILTNLVKNAVKFTQTGFIEFGYEKKGNFLEFFVKDTGVGICQEQKEIIFDRFRQGSEQLTREYEGSGLGLSISKAYVEMLGGKIWVDSELEKGSIFYFTIPYNAELKEKNAINNTILLKEKETSIKNLKIVIAEDDKASETLIAMAIEKFSKEVLKVRTGVEVVEVCRNNPDIDLVLMDIQMPKMNGYEAVRQIRQFNNSVIIIAQTAFSLSGERERAIEAGCNDYISKPFNRTVLYEVMKKHFINRGKN